MATLAPCLDVLRSEFNALNPNRDKASDGWIGDAAHASGDSDHNPDSNGVVHAIDVDETGPWPEGSMWEFVQYIISECRKSGTSGKDRGRLKYVIYERKIWSASNGWAEEYYDGSNPHDKHAHFSCEYSSTYANDKTSWGLADKFGGLPVDQSEFNKLMSGWASSSDGKKHLARAVFTWDPGDNSTGQPNDGIENPAYSPSNQNATVGANYALKRAIVASTEAERVNERLDQIEVTLSDCDQKLNQLLDPANQ